MTALEARSRRHRKFTACRSGTLCSRGAEETSGVLGPLKQAVAAEGAQESPCAEELQQAQTDTHPDISGESSMAGELNMNTPASCLLSECLANNEIGAGEDLSRISREQARTMAPNDPASMTQLSAHDSLRPGPANCNPSGGRVASGSGRGRGNTREQWHLFPRGYCGSRSWFPQLKGRWWRTTRTYVFWQIPRSTWRVRRSCRLCRNSQSTHRLRRSSHTCHDPRLTQRLRRTRLTLR